MPESRVEKLAQVMVHYSLAIKPGQKVYLQTAPIAHEFKLAFYEEALKVGAHVTFSIDGAYYPGAQEIFLKHASKKQLEFVINYSIPRFTKNMLVDEKLGGTIHLALGLGFPEAGGKNTSGLHWDMLCDMRRGEILVDGKPFYRKGQTVVS